MYLSILLLEFIDVITFMEKDLVVKIIVAFLQIVAILIGLLA